MAQRATETASFTAAVEPSHTQISITGYIKQLDTSKVGFFFTISHTFVFLIAGQHFISL